MIKWDGAIGGGGEEEEEESCRYEHIGGHDYLSHFFPVTLTMFINMQLIIWMERTRPLEMVAMDGADRAIDGGEEES